MRRRLHLLASRHNTALSHTSALLHVQPAQHVQGSVPCTHAPNHQPPHPPTC